MSKPQSVEMSSRKVILDFEGFDNRATKAIAANLILKHQALLPYWVGQVTAMDTNDTDGTMAIGLNPQYLHIKIYFKADFWQKSEEEQERTFLHEIAHTLFAEYSEFVERHILSAHKDKPDYEFMKAQHIYFLERATQCILYSALARKWPGWKAE